MARGKRGRGWVFIRALVNQESFFRDTGLSHAPFATCTHHGQDGHRLVARGSAISRGIEFLVLEKAKATSKVPPKPGRHALTVSRRTENIHQVDRVSSNAMRRASSGETHMASDGRIKSGFCGSNMSSLPISTGSKATQGISNKSAHQPKMGSPGA